MLASLFSDDRLAVFLSGLGLLALFFWYFATDFERKKRNIGTVLISLIAIFSLLSIVPQEKWGDVIKGETPLSKAHILKGGIDLVGGSSFTLRVQPGKDEDGNETAVTALAVQRAIQTIEKRLNALGTADLLIVAQGADRILVQMPGVTPEAAAHVRTILEKVARLELKAAHPDTLLLANKVAADPESEIVPGYKLYVLNDKDEDGKTTTENILLSQRTALDGSYVVHAQALFGAREGTLVVELNNEGATKMFNLTKAMNHGRDRLAIVLDGKVLSAPTVQGSLSKNFEISGMGTAKEAQALAAALLNPLKNPLIVEEQRSMSATLGKEIVHQGLIAGAAGLALTFIFVLLYYRFAGVIALIGLVVNILILFGAMAMFGFTFTLLGIAGIILTIGIAVDANVLIYERLREELAHGKTVKTAINTAYEKAFSAIFDANITTLLVALILFWKASGTVKGFAITLTIGILATMVSALLCTRILFWWSADTSILKKLNFMNLIPRKTLQFMNKRNAAFALSVILIIAGISTAVFKGEETLGIDFTGGAQLQFQLDNEAHIDQAKAQEVISALTLTKTASSQEEKNETGHLFSVRCAEDTTDIQKIEDALREAFPTVLKQRIPTLESDGSPKMEGDLPATQWKYQMAKDTISASLGKEFLTTACWALILGLIAILIYITIRFEFSFALGAFAAVAHDILICLGLVIFKGDELSLIHVAAFLTIAGYSINDTIVIFDRIREDLRSRRGDVEEVMNHAISITLSRTVLTSLTTFVVVLVLYIYGGGPLKAFSFAIMMGVLVGTYSSIFIASPIVYIWSKMRGSNLRRELLDANLEAEVNPAKS